MANVVIVLNSADASVSVLDPVARKEIRRFSVGKEPHHLMRTPDLRTLIVANAASNDLQFLDPADASVRRKIRDIADPYQIGFSPDRKWFVATALRLDRLDIYAADGDNLKIARRVPLGRTPSHVVFSADSQWAFVTLQDSHEIGAVRLSDAAETQPSSAASSWKMPVGELPAGIWMTPDDKYLLIGIMGKDYVEVVDWRARKSIKKIMTGKGAHNFRPLGDGRHIFVSNRVAGTVSLIDMQTLEKVYDIAVPGGPDCMDIAIDGRTMWVTQRWLKQVAMVDLLQRQVVHTIAVGRSPHGIFVTESAPWK